MLIYLIICLMFVAMQGFFAGIETGLVSLQRPRVRNAVKNGSRSAKILDYFLDHPGTMLATVLIGVNICHVGAALSAKYVAEAAGWTSPAAQLAMTGMLAVTLLVAEIIPKNWFRQLPFARCMIFAHVFYVAYLILCIPAKLLGSFTSGVNRLLKIQQTPTEYQSLMRDDFRRLLRESESMNLMDKESADILDRAIGLYSHSVGQVMAPIRSAIEITADATVADAVAICRSSGFSRLPVRKPGLPLKTPAPWSGVFTIYDAIYNLPETEWENCQVGDLMRPLQTISASQNLGAILTQSRQSRSPLLIVVSAKDPNQQVGIVSPADVVRILFG